jgi:MFS family permease
VTPSAPERAFQTLRYRDFRLLWIAETVSIAGSYTQRAAMGWQIYKLTGSELDLGLLGLAKFLPVLLFGVVGGVIADRGDRKRTLLLSQVLLLAVAATLALLTYTDQITLWWIYLLAFLDGVFFSVAAPTRRALIANLVPRSSLPAAATITNLGMNISQIAGPALGGVLIAAAGPGTAYLVDAISFGFVVISILMITTRIEPVAITLSGLESAKEGLSFLRRTPVLAGVMVTDALATFFGMATVLMPVFAEEIFHVGPTGFGLLLAAPAAGAVAMGLAMSVMRLPDRIGQVVLVSICVYGLAIFGFGITTSFVVGLICLALSGAADAMSATLRHAIRDIITPDHLRGRLAAIHRTLAVGGPQLGELRSGVTAAAFGVGPAVAVGGLLATLSVVAVGALVPAIGKFRVNGAVVEEEQLPSKAAAD